MSILYHDEAIRFYCGLGEKHYNHHPVVTGPYACVSPVSGSKVKKVNSVAVPEGVHVLQDSGAFNDACLLFRGQERRVSLMKQCRLSFKDALIRQEQHAIASAMRTRLKHAPAMTCSLTKPGRKMPLDSSSEGRSAGARRMRIWP